MIRVRDGHTFPKYLALVRSTEHSRPTAAHEHSRLSTLNRQASMHNDPPARSADTPEHILLTALGTQARESTYARAGRTAAARFAPVALIELLPEEQRPTRVLTIVTEGARTTAWPDFSESMQSQFPDITVDCVQVPSGIDGYELRQIVESVAAQVPAGCELTLDVTHGLRHFPFILYALALYLTSLRNVRLRGAYYGMIEASTGNASKPIVDLRPLLRLPEWFYAVRVFREFGLAAPIAERIRQDIQNPEPT
ncbi:MAG: TIGR02221 family CRISPR-associated protein, partial [Planctomycetota bacterium]